MRAVPAFFSRVAGIAFLFAFMLHVLAVLEVYQPDSALLHVLSWGFILVGAPLLFYGKGWRRRVGEPVPWSAIGGRQLTAVIVGLGVLLAYTIAFQLYVHAPTRWSIPDDPVPPLIGKLTTLVQAWLFAVFGALHYVELRRMPATLF